MSERMWKKKKRFRMAPSSIFKIDLVTPGMRGKKKYMKSKRREQSQNRLIRNESSGTPSSY